MTHRRPSTKIIALSIVCAALVASVGIWKILPHAQAESTGIALETDPSVTMVGDTQENIANNDIDSDHDGLKDWEEVLYGTDPHNPDTNGNGITDGDEAKASALAQAATSSQKTVYNKYVQANTLTDKISKNLFNFYMQAKQGGETLSADQIQQVADSAKADMPGAPSAHYTLDAVTTFPDSDIEAGTKYGQSFGREYLDALAGINQDSSSDSASMGRAYQALSRDLSILAVPASLHTAHVALINNLYNVGSAMVTLGNADKDPVNALLSIKQYRTLSSEQQPLFTAISNYFKRNGILFDDEEVQALWENI